MDWSEALGEVKWLAVVLATVSSFVVGMIWYHQSTFGKKWAKNVGISLKEMNNPEGMGERFFMTGVASFITFLVINALMYSTRTEGFFEGLLFGAILGFALRMGAHVIHNGFAKRSKELTWIDGLHDVVAVAIGSAIIGTMIG